MKNLLQDFVDILYPATCPGCGQVYASGESMLCLNCQLDMPLFKNEQVVEHILGGRIPVKEAAIYLKFYSGGLTQRLLHQVKYKGNRALGEYLGEQFILTTDNAEKFSKVDLIVPIPLHVEKLKLRGYNQSEIIAAGMAKVLGKPVDNSSVIRIARSATQTRKSREERWLNVDGIFECRGNAIKGKHVLLVDDVITTGATMEACALAILDSGAAAVSFAVLATAMK